MRLSALIVMAAVVLPVACWAAGEECPPELLEEEGKPAEGTMKAALDAGEMTYARALSDHDAATSMLAENPLTSVVAGVFMAENQPTDWGFDLRAAKFMGGVMAAWEETRDDKYFTYVKTWADHQLEQGIAPADIGSCVGGTILLALYEETEDAKYLDGANTCVAAAKELSKNGTNGNGAEAADQFCYSAHRDLVGAEFALAPFLARMGARDNDRECHDLAAGKIVRYMDYLRFHRRDNGPLKERKLREELFTHMLAEEGERLFPNLDQRGDGWLYLAMGEAFEYLPQDHPLRGRLVTFLENQGFRSLEFSPMVLGAAAGSLKIQYTHSLYVYGAAELLAVRPVAPGEDQPARGG